MSILAGLLSIGLGQDSIVAGYKDPPVRSGTLLYLYGQWQGKKGEENRPISLGAVCRLLSPEALPLMKRLQWKRWFYSDPASRVSRADQSERITKKINTDDVITSRSPPPQQQQQQQTFVAMATLSIGL